MNPCLPKIRKLTAKGTRFHACLQRLMLIIFYRPKYTQFHWWMEQLKKLSTSWNQIQWLRGFLIDMINNALIAYWTVRGSLLLIDGRWPDISCVGKVQTDWYMFDGTITNFRAYFFHSGYVMVNILALISVSLESCLFTRCQQERWGGSCSVKEEEPVSGRGFTVENVWILWSSCQLYLGWSISPFTCNMHAVCCWQT